MRAKPSVVLGLLAGLCAVAARGGTAQEVQVPIDEDGKVQVITADLERKLQLFSDYERFREARLFQLPDSSFVLEITHEPGGRLTRVRVPLMAEAAQDFRRRVSAGLRDVAPEAVLDQSGRTKLLVWTTALALLYYGPAAPIILEVDDPQGAVGLYMISASAGFFIPFLATKRIAATEAGAVLGTYGATRGIIHGSLAAYLFDPNPSERGFFGGGFLAGITEGIAGFAVANSGRMTPGTAELVGVGSDFGLGYGLGFAHLAGFFDTDYAPSTGFRDENEAGFAGLALLGTAGGAAAGYALSRTQPFTRGDAFVVRNAGFLGAHVGLALATMVDPDERHGKLYSGLAMLGATAGLGLGARLAHGRDFTTAQGTFVTLGHLAGGLVGLGLGVVASGDGDDGSLLVTTSAMGAALGYGLIYGSFASEAKVAAAGNLDLYVNPLALATLVRELPGARDRPVPVAGVSYRF
jgi:hypothetical protein